MKQIGFIGLGIMGSRMAANLQKSGYQLVIHNRTKEKGTVLLENGATWAQTPREAAEKTDVLITMLSTPEAIREIALGDQGFLTDLPNEAIWMNCSTVNPSFAKEMKMVSQSYQVRYLDVPVVGTKGPAETGELLFLIGGTEKDKEEVNALLDVMGKKAIYLGDVGRASSMKILINQLLGQSMAAFSEAMMMGEAMGLEQETLFNVLTATPVVAPVIASLRTKLESNNHEANFPLRLLQKDLHLSSVSAYECGVAAPNLNATKEMYALAQQHGYGDKDFSSLYTFLKHKQ